MNLFELFTRGIFSLKFFQTPRYLAKLEGKLMRERKEGEGVDKRWIGGERASPR